MADYVLEGVTDIGIQVGNRWDGSDELIKIGYLEEVLSVLEKITEKL